MHRVEIANSSVKYALCLRDPYSQCPSPPPQRQPLSSIVYPSISLLLEWNYIVEIEDEGNLICKTELCLSGDGS